MRILKLKQDVGMWIIRLGIFIMGEKRLKLVIQTKPEREYFIVALRGE